MSELDMTQETPAALGLWLRGLRLARDLPLRAVAAAAQMDQAVLSKIENGKRLPTDNCAAALARFFGIAPEEFRRRLVAARLMQAYGDAPFIASVAAQVQEDFATYGLPAPVNNPANKK